MKFCKYVLTVFWTSSLFPHFLISLVFFNILLGKQSHPTQRVKKSHDLCGAGTCIEDSVGREKHCSLQKELPATLMLCMSLHKPHLLPPHFHPQMQASGGGAGLSASVWCFTCLYPIRYCPFSVLRETNKTRHCKKSSPWTGCAESLFLAIYFCPKATVLHKISIYMICRYSIIMTSHFSNLPSRHWGGVEIPPTYPTSSSCKESIIRISKWLRTKVLNSHRILVQLEIFWPVTRVNFGHYKENIKSVARSFTAMLKATRMSLPSTLESNNVIVTSALRRRNGLLTLL